MPTPLWNRSCTCAVPHLRRCGRSPASTNRAGDLRTVEIRGGCSSCGTGDVVLAYDAAGNIVRRQDARGYISAFTYDAVTHSLTAQQTSMRPLSCDPVTDSNRCWQSPDDLATVPLTSTASTVTVTYEYGDGTWPDRPTASITTSVLAPGQVRREELAWHPLSGAPVSHRIIGWTGSPAAQQTRTSTNTYYDGVAAAIFDPGPWFDRAWLTLAQPRHERSSSDGPRTDATDVTQFVYYPVDNSVPALLRGRLAAVRNAAGQIQTFEEYDVFGNVTRSTDANGVVTTRTYDALGRPLSENVEPVSGCDTSADPLCATRVGSSRTYYGTAALKDVTAAGGGMTMYWYDSSSRLQNVIHGVSWSDQRDLMAWNYAPNNQPSDESIYKWQNGDWQRLTRDAYAYDTRGSRLAVTHLDGTSASYTYHPEGQLASVRDERHSSPNTFYAYDPAGRLTTVTQTLGNGTVVTSYGYDAHGNLTTVTDPNGNTTTYVYDDFGQLLRQQSPVTGTTTYTYDAGGNLTGTTDANGATTTRTYDVLGRILTQTSTRGSDTDSLSWTYDGGTFGKGRLTSMTDPTGSTTYTYDRRGLLLSETKTVQGTAYVTRYTYNADGNRASITYPSGRVATFTYDYAGRPPGVSLGGVILASAATYLPFGPLTGFAYGNGTTKRMTYDNRYRPVTNELLGPGGALASYTYTHDAAANITRIADNVDAGYTRDFGYDDLNRLVTANTGASLWGTGSYSYDAMGNLQTATLGTTTRSFAYSGTTPKLTSATENGATRTVTYDAAGNEQTVGGDLYLYSPRNLLKTDSMAFEYDGRSVRTISTRASMILTQRYSFYTPELNLLAETEESTFPNKSIAHEYVWFAGQPLTQVDAAGTVASYFNDHLGTPLLQTDAASAVVWRAEYEPYGQVHAFRAGATRHQPLRFPGQENDSTIEVSYNIFRWYRAGWGRYTQSDRYIAVRHDEPNLFAYASGNPTRVIDPLGLFSLHGSCDCSGRNWNVPRIIAKACNYRKAPKCQEILSKNQFVPFDRLGRGRTESLKKCLDRRCGPESVGDPFPKIYCSPARDDCGYTPPGGNAIWLYDGPDDCPRRTFNQQIGQKGGFRDYSQTLFHEMLHTCGLGVPQGGGEFKVMLDVTEVCTGVRR